MTVDTPVNLWIFLLLLLLALTSTSESYDARCPPGITDGYVEAFGCLCYQFTEEVGIWTNNECKKHGGKLAEIKDSTTNDYIRSKVRQLDYGSEDGIWIGASRDDKDAPFKWTDGTLVKYTNWVPDEPDNYISPQNCVYLKRIHFWQWATMQCHIMPIVGRMPYACQYDIKNCTKGTSSDEGLTTGAIVGITVGSVVGIVLVGILISWVIVCCKSAVSGCRKRKRQQQSIRYYTSGPTSSRSSTVRQTYRPPDSDSEAGENELNELVVAEGCAMGGSEGFEPNMKPKGSGLPTAGSIDAEASGSLVVDMHTGKSTIKKVNTKSRPDNASTRSLKSFKLDANDRTSNDQVSNHLSVNSSSSTTDIEDNGLLANLDNVDKPATAKSKAFDLP